MQDFIEQIGSAATQLRDALKPLLEVGNLLSNGVIAVFTVILAGVAIYQGVITRRALKATQLAAEASKAVADTAALGERPWITLEASANKPLKFESRIPRIGVRVLLKNIGKTPASSVAIQGRLVPHFHPQSQTRLEDLMESFTRTGSGWPDATQLQSHTMFPGEDWETDQYYYPTESEVNEYFSSSPSDRPEFDLAVIIVVGYVSAVGSTHLTYFRSRVRIQPDPTVGPLLHGLVNGEIPADKVSLEIHSYGNRDHAAS